ncbi:hypothetical protein C2E20_4751 [Micractinium conductrix]|uniref:Uncharacterized protein n=1 Tax=Micractinium conductrix TaxID=554055 RepID=A0A2P6VD15_9CHLO|nr:hypothetical protein C2E20_4751 [Micractinium conductrix]|eukprot:PSC71974.1 hypothetical protein C2E20_4751 [Micractinium conductrix]
MDAEQMVEKKLGMSLDELIAAQAKKKATAKPKAKAAGGGRIKKVGKPAVQKVQTNGGGRVLVVPRPSHVPRPSGSAAKTAAALKATRGGGVHKGGAAPKFMGAGGGGGGGNRNVKVTIGNKLSGRAPTHLPTSGVLARPFCRGGGRAPMHVEGLPPGGTLAARFDTLGGQAPAGAARPTGAPRRNAHGVLIP